jgi:hypothetical protein
MEIFHFLPTRQVNSQAYDITANIMISITAYFCLPYWNLININELAMDRKW